MGNIFECTQINAFVVTKLAVRHVSVILDNFTNEFRRHVLLARFDKAELLLGAVALALEFFPITKDTKESKGEKKKT